VAAAYRFYTSGRHTFLFSGYLWQTVHLLIIICEDSLERKKGLSCCKGAGVSSVKSEGVKVRRKTDERSDKVGYAMR